MAQISISIHCELTASFIFDRTKTCGTRGIGACTLQQKKGDETKAFYTSFAWECRNGSESRFGVHIIGTCRSMRLYLCCWYSIQQRLSEHEGGFSTERERRRSQSIWPGVNEPLSSSGYSPQYQEPMFPRPCLEWLQYLPDVSYPILSNWRTAHCMVVAV